MRVFLTGATGAIGKPLVAQLIAAGHEVVGLTTRPEGAKALEALGAEAVVGDALDAGTVGRAVSEAAPDAIVHEATALAGGINPRRLDRDFAKTNRLRTEGTDLLLSAGRAAGVKRFVAQSFGGWPYARTGGPVKHENDPLDSEPPGATSETLGAIRHLERAVTGAEWTEGIVLRYAGFYGPGTNMAVSPRGEMAEMVGKRWLPLIGDGGGVWSFIHVEDAASATVAALERGERGIYNVADDEPVRVREWLPAYAEALGAKAPRRMPAWLARLVAGEAAVLMMTESRGASNDKARSELGWSPRHPSLRGALADGSA
jgi:nucleoside-diphosphate-sugar epimerase